MALALCLTLFPVTALAAAPQTLYVGDYQITNGSAITYLKAGSTAGSLVAGSENDWTVKYEPSIATLTLNGAKIQGGTSTGSVPYGAGIYAQCKDSESVSLTIELIGNNTITGYYGIYVNAEISENSNGTDASLTITGENNVSLEVSGSFYGIFVKSGTGNASVTIENASVDAKTTQTNSGYAGVCVQSGASSKDSPNLSLAVNGGSLTTSGSASGDGIQFVVGAHVATRATTSLTVTDNAIVDARNGGISASRTSVTLPTPTPTGNNSSGIVFNDKSGTVYGKVELQEDITIDEGESLTIPNGSSLNGNGKLTNKGTIIVEKGGNLTGDPGGKVVYAPAITNHPQDVEVKEDETATFTVEATGSDLSYQWQQSTDKGSSWTNIARATSDTYTTGKTTMDMSGTQYRCVVSNSAGSVISDAATLTVRYKGKTIADVLQMDFAEAAEFFESQPRISDPLKLLSEPGLGYLTLGQASNTLSGGEAQRLKLVTELIKGRRVSRNALMKGKELPGDLYLIEEPSIGLHPRDVRLLIDVLHRLADQGNTVVVIEHNTEIMAEADYVIDMGPGPGDAGGTIVAEGTPEQIARKESTTTEYIRRELNGES